MFYEEQRDAPETREDEVEDDESDTDLYQKLL